MGYFDVPVDHMYGQAVILDYLAIKTIYSDDLVVVSPDVGVVARAPAFAKKLSNTPLDIVDKRRHGYNIAKVMNLISDVKGNIAVIVDDMFDTAGTIAKGAELLHQEGAREVYTCSTHAVFRPLAVENLSRGLFQEVIITNTAYQLLQLFPTCVTDPAVESNSWVGTGRTLHNVPQQQGDMYKIGLVMVKELPKYMGSMIHLRYIHIAADASIPYLPLGSSVFLQILLLHLIMSCRDSSNQPSPTQLTANSSLLSPGQEKYFAAAAPFSFEMFPLLLFHTEDQPLCLYLRSFKHPDWLVRICCLVPEGTHIVSVEPLGSSTSAAFFLWLIAWKIVLKAVHHFLEAFVPAHNRVCHCSVLLTFHLELPSSLTLDMVTVLLLWVVAVVKTKSNTFPLKRDTNITPADTAFVATVHARRQSYTCTFIL